MNRVKFTSYPLRDEIAAVLWDAYRHDVIPAPDVINNVTVQVEAPRLVCESAIRRIRAKFGNRVEIWTDWQVWTDWQ
jgi:hypothetical protein